MLAPENHFRTVHVLRHTFRPSEALTGHLNEFTTNKPGQSMSRFLLASTRAIAMDSVDLQNYKYERELRGIEVDFHKNAGGVALAAVGHRMDAQGNLRLRFTPKDMDSFKEITDPIDTLPGIAEHSDRGDSYYVVATLARRALASKEDLSAAWGRLRSSFQNPEETQLFSAYPYDISGPQVTVNPDYVQPAYG